MSITLAPYMHPIVNLVFSFWCRQELLPHVTGYHDQLQIIISYTRSVDVYIYIYTALE